MTPNQLEKCGKALFPGRNWKSSLAKALGVDRMTVNRWNDGDYTMPDEPINWDIKIRALMEKQVKELTKLLEK